MPRAGAIDGVDGEESAEHRADADADQHGVNTAAKLAAGIVVLAHNWSLTDFGFKVPLSFRERVGVRGSYLGGRKRTAESPLGSPHPGPLPEGEGDSIFAGGISSAIE